MAWSPVTIDDSILSEGGAGRIRVDDGDYLGVVAGIRTTSEDYEGPAAWIWQLRIKEGPSSVGRTIGQWGTFKEGAQFGNGQILSLLGAKAIAESLSGQTIGTFKLFQDLARKVLDKVKGKEVGFYASEDPSSGGKYSRINEIYSSDEYRERAAIQTGDAVEADAEDGEDAPASVAKRGRGRPAKAVPAPVAVAKKSLDTLMSEFGLD